MSREQSTATPRYSLGDAFNSRTTASPRGSPSVRYASSHSSAASQATQSDAFNASPTASPAEQPAMRIPSIRLVSPWTVRGSFNAVWNDPDSEEHRPKAGAFEVLPARRLPKIMFNKVNRQKR
ncbi:hypothetical protein E4U17_005998 [Claviceps sp. LM77 group G4]|nr:hypothetical protein E4U33_000696 [Claviceps sp. LM78 group G4]KAG6059603.1 hypothetical protein E4U17_005998 [Claviceps sp. LM77 group G4]